MMEYSRKSRLKKVINAKDVDQPRTLSPILTEIRSNSQTMLHNNYFPSENEVQTYSKSMQIILRRKPQRLVEVQSFLSPGSPQLKSCDKEQPRQGQLTQQIRKSKSETKNDFIQVSRIENPLQFQLKSKLYERRAKRQSSSEIIENC